MAGASGKKTMNSKPCTQSRKRKYGETSGSERKSRDTSGTTERKSKRSHSVDDSSPKRKHRKGRYR